ncbi:hypothetical protein [Flavobacterium sangjuense]|uniref:Uncharacterized protein n=1 Tax=Flavobacterium sangjuense TaxID=2518177 RepID=A0A4P7PSF2_9FLAO|nr:hypothetical protein [Flavobacterium sangjuense]QBZ97566.1 hypothetical protein GS03_01058 [Flavobacterium sangjuense]
MAGIDSDEMLENNETGNIFIADYNHGEAKMKDGMVYVNPRWLNNETLIIDYDKNARTFKKEDSENGIKIIYKE